MAVTFQSPSALAGHGSAGSSRQAQAGEAGRIANLIERDAYLKRAMGFGEGHFTRLGEVLRTV
jgi:hypothetical protein